MFSANAQNKLSPKNAVLAHFRVHFVIFLPENEIIEYSRFDFWIPQPFLHTKWLNLLFCHLKWKPQ